jgi:phage-related tail fiber protein
VTVLSSAVAHKQKLMTSHMQIGDGIGHNNHVLCKQTRCELITERHLLGGSSVDGASVVSARRQ